MTLVVYNGITFQIYITGDRQNQLEDWRYLTVYIKKTWKLKLFEKLAYLLIIT